MRAAGFAIMLAAVAGCGRDPAPGSSPPSATPAVATTRSEETAKSSVSTVIDGLTGKTAVEAGKRARGQIEKIGKQEQHDINEAMQP